MTDQLKNEFEIILNYIFEAEAKHYEESGEPANHIYALALQAKKTLESQ